MSFVNMDKMCCKAALTHKMVTEMIDFDSSLFQEIKSVDTHGCVINNPIPVPFVYMYNGIFPMMISVSHMGLRSWYIKIESIKETDIGKMTVYKQGG